MYVAVKGGERAIAQSVDLVARARRGDPAVPELSVEQIRQQMRLAVARVMTEGSLYDEDLAALAIKQAAGDLVEAIFLLRAYRTTLKRLGDSVPLDTANMRLERRISSAFKDLPGGQVLGPTYDYTQRLLDFALMADAAVTEDPAAEASAGPIVAPRVTDLLAGEGLLETSARAEGDPDPSDLTREPLQLPADRATRLQNLARGDEGYLLALGYSTQRGYGTTHPFAAEIRFGAVALELFIDELGFAVKIGEVDLTECQLITDFEGSAEAAPQFTRGYGLAFGHSERKAMAMALVDRALRAGEFGEDTDLPANNEEFVLAHSDNVEASGFVQHLKLPHYVDFQTNLELLRRLRAQWDASNAGATGDEEPAA
ncbi:carbon-phosphorus lyase complex subunit PhnI [Azoarcus sp. L1K30]|uniref:carbon-phosphorus lyase complex subunit PhnI n=1 Tax=Azoarcus sp. L1K30 TaxID=2820277 RepID=UPI001B8208D6|nr:carbon-phosphorus lyase complex subunit PhnI [Azoarcus sp. L1K30]MBR0568206.1 carbon-phosphorus lyase complex subunit PhnI [Azoarcus sp. L1K30]